MPERWRDLGTGELGRRNWGAKTLREQKGSTWNLLEEYRAVGWV